MSLLTPLTAPTDPDLVAQGRLDITQAEDRMPVLSALRARLVRERPLEDQRIIGSNHITKESAVLVRTLAAAGAELAWCASNPATTQDDVAAALAADGIRLFARQGMTRDEYYGAIEQTIGAQLSGPTLVVDEGGDLLVTLHERAPERASACRGGTDKTATGVNRVRALANAGRLAFPVIAVNEAFVKSEVDSTIGTGQSTIDGILRATGMLLAGKTFVVSGYGHVGRGTALRARGLGAHVVVTEVHPTAAMRALLEGFDVRPMQNAAGVGDVFCTATGMRDVIRGPHLDAMKDGAILCNVGHFDCEINLADLEARTRARRRVRPHMEEHQLANGRRVFLLAEGRLVNLAAGEGNPSEVMDMTFAAQVLALLRLAADAGSLEPGVYPFGADQDEELARLKLATLGIETDRLSADQEQYAVSGRPVLPLAPM